MIKKNILATLATAALLLTATPAVVAASQSKQLTEPVVQPQGELKCTARSDGTFECSITIQF